MKVDVSGIEAGSTLQHDVVIIGAGAAGISMARDLSGGRLSVALLESGGFAPDPDTQALYKGQHETNAFDPAYTTHYLPTSRQRFFGGGTNCWAGWSVPFNSWDLDKREFMPHSGWPITHDDIAAWYPKAQQVLKVDSQFEPWYDEWLDPFADNLIVDSEQAFTELLHRSGEIPRFNTLYRDDILNSPNVELFLNTNFLEFECTPDKSSVQRIRVSTLDGKVFYFEAKQFILATGGIENPRLLLASRKDFPEGLGNQHDMVGRFFMEHLELRHVADLFLIHHEESLKLYYRMLHEAYHLWTYATIVLTEETQKKHGLLNCSFYIERSNHDAGRSTPEFHSAVGRVSAQLEDFHADGRRFKNPAYMGTLTTRSEVTPHPDNRITLVDNDLDDLGMPRPLLDWKVQPSDYDGVYRSLELLGQEFGRTGKGRLKITMDRYAPTNNAFGGPHHMGTTRMHTDPKQGVVDGDCKVHGISNLYIAGSSVFTTGGFANPTLSIVALGLRLTDHLKKKMGAA